MNGSFLRRNLQHEKRVARSTGAVVYAVITAGGRVDGAFSSRIGSRVKALARVGAGTLIATAVQAARAAGAQRVAVVGGAEIRDAVAGTIDDFIPEAQDGAQNVHLALRHYADAPLLYLSSDMPYVTGSSLREFLDRAPERALAMPLADAASYEQRFPGAPEHATVIGGERVANASAFFIPAGAAPVIDEVAQRLFAARKSLVRMAVLLGPVLLTKFALRTLRIADIESKAAKLLGLRVCAVRDCAPELCFDVDALEDYEYALEHS